MKKLFYIVTSVGLLLSGCAYATEIPVPTNTIAIIPSKTLTSIPPALTEIPTRKSITSTATISIPATPSYTPTATSVEFTSLLTAQVSWNICDGAEEPLYKNDLSPNGEWLAVVCDPNDLLKFNGTKIVSLDGNVIWGVSFYDTYGISQKDDFSSDGIRKGRMSVVHWTKDGNYAYLVPYFCCADSPGNTFFNYFQNTLALYRLDLQTGKITTTLQPFRGDVFSGYNASLSPSDKYLAYVISSDPRDIHISNLQIGDSFTIKVGNQYVASGKFSWSQDGNKFVYMAVRSGWSYGNASIDNGVSYFLLDLKTQSSVHLFDKQDIYRVSWTQDGNIILHNASGKDGLFYNLQDNEFTVVTSTPTP